jgi:hypothetical protein
MMNSADDRQQLDGVDVIHLWCGPRSLSIATMYSFAQRSDTVVVDEPLYGSYLKRNPSVYRPYRDDLLTSTEVDPDIVIQTAHSLAVVGQKKIVFMKHLGIELMNMALYHDER